MVQFVSELDGILNFEEAMTDPAVGQALYTALLGKAAQLAVGYRLPVAVIVHDACSVAMETYQVATMQFREEMLAKMEVEAAKPPPSTEVN